jgi:ParB family chromosome partitioning protein
MTINIPIEKLHPHPKNPRMEVGDVTELAESIKAMGILQNLTVVESEPGEAYTVIIGHRRLSASKLAGLIILPCIVADMDEKEQIATMLLENIQRRDLTVWEEARGFQMMLDLGETQKGIAEKTGFSASTVSRRVKLLDLDADKFKASSERGATLMDYAALNEIEDIAKRNELLDHIGTKNFDYKFKEALTAQKNEKKLAPQIAAFAVRAMTGEISRRSYITIDKKSMSDALGKDRKNAGPHKALLAAAWSAMDALYGNDDVKPRLYAELETLGYATSDNERALFGAGTDAD